MSSTGAGAALLRKFKGRYFSQGSVAALLAS
jgi:hypothetical protein